MSKVYLDKQKKNSKPKVKKKKAPFIWIVGEERAGKKTAFTGIEMSKVWHNLKSTAQEQDNTLSSTTI